MQVLVVEDELFGRRGTVDTIIDIRSTATVWQAGSLHQAKEQLESHPTTDLVLLDLNLPDSTGMATLEDLTQWCDDRDLSTRMVVLTAYYTPDLVAQALDIGAIGYIVKGRVTEESFAEALTETMAGNIWIPSGVAPLLGASSSKTGPLSQEGQYPDCLTERQKQVCDYLLWGLTYKQIARFLPPIGSRLEPPNAETVRAHVNKAAESLGVTSNRKAGLVAALYVLKVTSRIPRPTTVGSVERLPVLG